jgi:hypothetical protein
MSTKQVRVIEVVRIVSEEGGVTRENYFGTEGEKLFEREVGVVEIKHGFIAGRMGPNDEHISPVVASLEVVPAPGDMCGNTKTLPNGQPCPGCRACS